MSVRSVVELVDERRHKIKTLEDMVERAKTEGDRNFTPDERASMDALEKEIKALKVQIEERMDHERRLERVGAHVDTLSQPLDPDDTALSRGGQPHSPRGAPYPRVLTRTRKLTAFVNADGSLDERGAYRSGMWLAGSLGNEKAFRWCQSHDIHVRAMSEGINTAGGAYVPEETSQRIIDLRESYGVFRQNTFIEPMARETKNIVREVSGPTAYFVGEGVELTESDIAVDLVKLVAKKLAVRTRVSSELEEDSMIDIGDRFADRAAWALALKEDQTGFNGDGTSTYGGLQGISNKFTNNTGFAGVLQTTDIDTYAEVTNIHLGNLMALLPGYVVNPKWFVSRAAWAAMFQRLAIAAGGNTVQNIEGGFGMFYMGFPIVISQVMNATLSGDITADTVMVLFGDLALASTLGDRRGMVLKRSDEKHWETDEIALKLTERMDINVHNIGDATDAGAVVAMIAH